MNDMWFRIPEMAEKSALIMAGTILFRQPVLPYVVGSSLPTTRTGPVVR
jgi:hypothetical protein